MKQFIRFGMAGLPGFILAIPLNIALIEWAHWRKPLAYLLVVWMQMTAGFIMCHYFVFERDQRRSLLRAYLQFAGSMALIRTADWGTYTALVEWARIPYVLAQLCCTAIFLFVKFVSAKAIFRSRQV